MGGAVLIRIDQESTVSCTAGSNLMRRQPYTDLLPAAHVQLHHALILITASRCAQEAAPPTGFRLGSMMVKDLEQRALLSGHSELSLVAPFCSAAAASIISIPNALKSTSHQI